VLAVGDAEFQKKCLGKMQDVAKGGRTVLFVSHNMGAVQSLCSQGILLEKGKIHKKDETSKVVEAYSKSSLSRKKIKRENKQDKQIFIKEAEATFIKDTGEIEISLEVESKRSSKISVECRLLDTYQAPLAFLSRGRLDMSQKINLGTGKKRLVLKGKLPRLLKGRYFLWISLADPLVTHLDICEDLLEIDLEFSPNEGSHLDISPGLGFGHVEVPLKLL
jgi:lipopolysaccharide transport system ATP-binding protein